MDSAKIIPQRWPHFSNEWTIIIYPDNVFNMVKTITVNLFFGTHLFVMVLWGMVCGSGFTPVYIYMCVCVCGGNPCSEGLWSHVQFLVTVPNLQAGAHGILDPPCATKLRSWMGYQGWSPWRTCSWSRCSFIIQAFWWLSGYYFLTYAWIIREIGVRYAFFRIYPFLRLLPNVDKDGLPELSM